MWRALTAGAAAVLVCGLFGPQSMGVKAQAPAAPTFYKDVLPILQKNCQGCHRPGQIGPFSMLSYESTRPWARSIKTRVMAKQMPPWFADPHYGPYANDPSLRQEDVDLLAKWADAGAPSGDPRDAPPPVDWAAAGWTVAPDVIVRGMPFSVPAHPKNNVIEWATYIVPTGMMKDTWITSLEIKPSDFSVTHHICISFVEHDPNVRYYEPVWSDKARDDDGVEIGSTGIASPRAPRGVAVPRNVTNAGGFDGCFVPGRSFEDYRIFNSAKLIPAGSDLSIQIHYTPNGKDTIDSPEFGMTVAPQAPQRIYVSSGTSAPGDPKSFAIPPNDPNWASPPAEVMFMADCDLVWMMPHMHLRGKDMTYTLIYPDGRQQVVLNVPRYDFNWQLGYIPAKPIQVVKGTRLIVTAHFDNSTANKFNPDPNRTVYMGNMTWEEMMFPFFSVVVDKGVDPKKVIKPRFGPPDGVGGA